MNAWLTVPDVAEKLNFHPKTIRLWCTKGIFPGAVKWPDEGPTARWRIPKGDVEALIRKRTMRESRISNSRLDELMDAALASH